MCEKGNNSIRENSIMLISRNVGERETTQLEKIVLCVSPEMCQKGHNSIRENGIMFIS